MNLTTFQAECGPKGTKVKVWADCHSVEDCDTVIAWLQLAKTNIRQWEKIRAKAAHAAKAPPSKNENHKPRQVQSKPQEEGWANRLHCVEAAENTSET